MRNDFQISVIVPTWNEAEQLPRTLESLKANSVQSEILIVDAGSSDGTARVAEEFGSTVLNSAVRQRASQLNLGGSRARGNMLLFLHADTLLPGGALEGIVRALRKAEIVGGAFVRKFDSTSIFLRASCLGAEIRNRLIGWHLGDQAIFCRRSVFEEIGGFKEMDRFEDLDFSRRLGKAGKIVTIRPAVISSARRFEREGPILRTWRDFLLTIEYLKGNPAAWRKSAGHRPFSL